jgi:hypothetical protein
MSDRFKKMADAAIDEAQRKADRAKAEAERDGRLKIKSSGEFCRSFVPPDPLIENLLMRQYLYSLTANTGAGKTAVALLLAYLVANGLPLNDLEVDRGRVLYLAGENPVDVWMRWMVMSKHLNFDRDNIDVHFIDEIFKISRRQAWLAEHCLKLGGIDLVVVDSSTVFFEGDNENDIVQCLEHAKLLRELTKLPGKPTALALCHPTKNASPDCLLPRGGGSFLGEVDGNLSQTINNMVSRLHWQGKIRGPDFKPIHFQLHGATSEDLISPKGKQLWTVYATAVTEAAHETIRRAAVSDSHALLLEIDQYPDAPQVELARHLQWFTRKGDEDRSRISRMIKELKAEKLIEDLGGKLGLTAKGRRALKIAENGHGDEGGI